MALLLLLLPLLLLLQLALVEPLRQLERLSSTFSSFKLAGR